MIDISQLATNLLLDHLLQFELCGTKFNKLIPIAMPKRTVRDRRKVEKIEEQAVAQKDPIQTDEFVVSVRKKYMS